MQTKYILQKSNQRNVVDGVSECKSMSKRGVESECLKSRNLGEGGGKGGYYVFEGRSFSFFS